MDKNKNLMRFSKLIFKKNKLKLLISFLLAIGSSFLSLYIPQITSKIVDDGIIGKNPKILINLVIIFISITFAISIIDILLEYLYSIMKNKVTTYLKIRFFDHLSKLSGRYFSSIKTGNLFSIVNQDLYIIESFSAELLFSIVMNFFTAAIS